ncbi:MAG: bifunctional phosphoribosyl-AMP cyclohydrolase/phosphoribosyl-ATP pyrophosphatase [Campylobacteraceae bacterium 4484_4]|nr:MAG: bifunctional phosphoribosyl-AMP cyclohydrolase/phosphoribosyl-ATP pyrophosphatase [Campylobacteraceae bacterium 4484_4]
MEALLSKIDWEKSPLIPAIAQDAKSGEVLMLAYMDKEALKKTLETKKAHYFSRSKQRLWMKGESSGHVQIVKDILVDCDNDTLLLKIEQVGGSACHTGRRSCFFTRLESREILMDANEEATASYGIIDKLYHVIQERKQADPENSYVASLFHKGENSLLKKVVEEAGEFCFAVKDRDEKEIVYEGADLAFHVLVALAKYNIDPDRIKQELARRFGLSGIEEKRSRSDRDKDRDSKTAPS